LERDEKEVLKSGEPPGGDIHGFGGERTNFKVTRFKKGKKVPN